MTDQDLCCVTWCPNVGEYTIPQIIENKGDKIRNLSSKRRAAWIATLKLKKPDWNPTEDSKVCCIHFVSGYKAHLLDVKNPDWVPSVFMHTTEENQIERSDTTATLIKKMLAEKKEATQRKNTLDVPTPLLVKSSTYQRWINLREELELESDDAVAGYLLDMFDRSLHEVMTEEDEAIEKTTDCTNQNQRTPKPTSSQKGTSSSNVMNDIVDIPFDCVPEPPEPDVKNKDITDESAPSMLTEIQDSGAMVTVKDGSFSPLAKIQNLNSSIDSLVNAKPENAQIALQSSKDPSDKIKIAPHQCFLCKSSFEDKESLTKHARDKHETVYMCKLCHSCFGLTQFEQHQKEKHGKGNVNNREPDAKPISVKVVWKPLMDSSVSTNQNTIPGSEIKSKQVVPKTGVKVNMNEHIIVSVTNKLLTPQMYTCGTCKRKFVSVQVIEKHKIEEHGKVDKFKCRLCCVTYRNKRGLSIHMSRDHKGSPLAPHRCSLCESAFRDKESLAKHTKYKHETIFTCKFCDRVFNNNTTYEKHEKSMHVENDDGTVTNCGFECEACKQVFKSDNALSRHMNLFCRKKGLVFACNKCNDAFEAPHLLVDHYKEEHDEDVDIDTIATDKCSCGEMFSSPAARKRHKCAQRLNCPHCDKTYKNQTGLDQHIAVVHSKEKPKYTCETCGRVYNRLQNLRCHQVEHVKGKRMFKCKLCPKEYTSKQSLGDHVRKHTGEAVLCPQCGKNFASMKILRHHEKMMHFKKRTHACHICKKAYYDSYTLQQHVDSHFGTRTLKCKFCDKKFTYSSARTIHQRSQHPEEFAAYMKDVRERNKVERIGPGTFFPMNKEVIDSKNAKTEDVEFSSSEEEEEDNFKDLEMDVNFSDSENEKSMEMVEVKFKHTKKKESENEDFEMAVENSQNSFLTSLNVHM